MWQANDAVDAYDVDGGTWQVDGTFERFPVVLPGFLGEGAATVTLEDVRFSTDAGSGVDAGSVNAG
ncbi:MAG: hypothetical protein GY822_10390 [Deltaproteobacteria bacterium]|nr:hypothetical protein [Deltaproteobacteria bacterium]